MVTPRVTPGCPLPRPVLFCRHSSPSRQATDILQSRSLLLNACFRRGSWHSIPNSPLGTSPQQVWGALEAGSPAAHMQG